MTCGCTISVDIGDDDGLLTVSEREHNVEVVCSECEELVEHALFTVYVDDESNPMVNAICEDCLSVRNNLFCDFPFRGLWNAFYDVINDASGECEQFLISESCMRALTPKARADVCAALEDHWEDLDRECGGGEDNAHE